MILTAKTMKMSIRPLEVALLVHKMERLYKYVFTVTTTLHRPVKSKEVAICPK